MPDANHHVYAYRVGYPPSVSAGMSDDGEPSGTSGPPVLAVLRGADLGDTIIIVNAEKVRLTGKKLSDKLYYWHTGHPGGIKSRTAGGILSGAHPERVIVKAVKRMVPSGPLGRRQLGNLKVYAGATHPHEAQQPEVLDVAAMNPKNKRSI